MGHLKPILTAASFCATGSSHPPYHVVHPRGRGPKQCPHTWRPGGGDLRPSLRARASCKQIAPHEGSKQSSRPGRGPSQRSRRRGWQPRMYLPCGPLPTLQAKKSRIKSVKAALLVPRPSRVGEEQRGFGTFRNRLSPRRGKGVRGVPRGPLTCLYALRAHSL